jgi:ABC-2 type transport system ATP-binding protein
MVSGVCRSFGPVRALQGISFEVTPGEVFGLVGPDGAGKTTTMRILAAILSPDSGSARILGLDSVRDRSAIHDRTGYMSQRFGLYGDLTVDENMAFYADLYGVGRAELATAAGRLLEWSALAPFRKRKAGQLSGGMKQKLGLACALIHRPELLLLDEPTNGVDPVSRKEFWELLRSLVEGGLSIVVTTSYLEEAERCRRLAFLDHGLITAAGTPGEILDLIPGGVFSFTSESPFVESALLSGPATHAVATVFGSTIHVAGETSVGEMEAVLGRNIDASRSKGTLEDAFLYLAEHRDA